MKRVLIASVIGMAAVASSYGQGQILFDNYSASMGQIEFTTDVSKLGTFSASLAGTPVGSEFNIALFAVNGDTSSTSAFAISPVATSFVGFGAGATADGDPGAGYFAVGAITVPSYTPGSDASFYMEAYIGASYAGAAYRGISSVWTEPAANITQSNLGAKGPFLNGPGVQNGVGFYVANVPEPTTFALLGLGSAALLIFRRK